MATPTDAHGSGPTTRSVDTTADCDTGDGHETDGQGDESPMTGLFRPFKRRVGIIVVAIAAVGGIGVLVSPVVGDALLAGGAGLIAVGYVVAVLVGLFTAREPRSVAYLAVAVGGVLLTLSALAGAIVTFVVAALLLAAAGGLLYRAGRPPTPDDSPGGPDRPMENGPAG